MINSFQNILNKLSEKQETTLTEEQSGKIEKRFTQMFEDVERVRKEHSESPHKNIQEHVRRQQRKNRMYENIRLYSINVCNVVPRRTPEQQDLIWEDIRKVLGDR